MTDTASLRKARGAFFTPSRMTDFLAEWAIRSPSDSVLEPSCGEAGFLVSAGRRLRSMGALAPLKTQLRGVEIYESSAHAAAALLASEGFSVDISVRDFFDVPASSIHDVVIGNPPYVRYQEFSGQFRAKALQAALAQGVRLTQLASSWAAFTVHASQFLKPEGRLGLVLPAELLSVNYAAQVRRFLLNRFRSVRLVMFEDLVFPGVTEEVVMLLAEGTGGAKSFEVYQAKNLDDLANMDAGLWSGFTPEGDEKWTPALLPNEAFQTYQELTEGAAFETLLDWGETSLGSVTGNNDYFTLTRAEVDELGIRDDELLKISPPGSRHLRGLAFSDRAWERLAKDGSRCYLFAPAGDVLSRAARRYVEKGEKEGVHKAYKCRMRKPWWRVPIVKKPDLLFTYMNHDRPRLTTNGAGVYLLNSLYGVALKADRRKLGRELLPIACLNSVTLLGAEMVGRAYGGGLLKHEPKEADLLPVPSFKMMQAVADKLRLLQPQMASILRQNDLAAAVELVDRVLLDEHLGLKARPTKGLRKARDLLFQRRVARSRGERGED